MKVRVSCVVAHDDEMALIYRERDGRAHWSLPGGNVGEEEDIQSAMVRELHEELGLNGITPDLLFLQDMLIHRPHREGLYRKLHIIFRVFVTTDQRRGMKVVEHDDLLPPGEVRWIPRGQLATLYLYPGVGHVLSLLPSLDAPVKPSALPPLTDETYSWQ